MKKIDTKCHVYCASFAFDKALEDITVFHFVDFDEVIYVRKTGLNDYKGGYFVYDIYFYVPDETLFTDIYFKIFNKEFEGAVLKSCLPQSEVLLLFCERFKTLSYVIPVWADGSFHLEDYILAEKKGKGNDKK